MVGGMNEMKEKLLTVSQFAELTSVKSQVFIVN
jgi:hypothetical protein